LLWLGCETLLREVPNFVVARPNEQGSAPEVVQSQPVSTGGKLKHFGVTEVGALDWTQNFELLKEFHNRQA
jgi:hypothetical protein